MSEFNLEQFVADELEERRKAHADELKSFEERVRNINVALEGLIAEGVIQSDKIYSWARTCGDNFEIADPAMWGKIHKVVGDLRLCDKTPVGDKRNQIRIIMTPNKPELNGWLRFSYVRKLTKDDKCKVKTVVKKKREVVCGV